MQEKRNSRETMRKVKSEARNLQGIFGLLNGPEHNQLKNQNLQRKMLVPL